MPASDAMQPTPKRKAVILTALSVEFQAVLAHLTGSREEVHSSGTVYERGDFQAESGTWDVLLVETGAGNSRAALEVERAIQYFSPEVALFVGVAGGMKDVTLGDVVFASKVYGYEAGKASAGFEPRPETGEGSYVLLQRARAVARNTSWLRRLGQSLEGRQPRALPGPIAAGEKVIAETRSQEYQFLRQQYGDALAVEMEGRGFLTGTWANRNVEALVIRGISDLIDRKVEADAQGSQELASKHASAFAFEVLARFVLPERASAPVMARPPERARLWMVPFSRNQNFTGRAVLLHAIREHFLANPSRPAPLALFGLGGVGKTQLAVEYASRYALDERSYSQVFWLRSDEPSVLASSYAGLARELDLPEKSETEHELKVRAVQQWLQWNEGWLLVFDNAEEPSAVRPYLPLVHRGHVLITSRNATWGELAAPLPVQVMERTESIEFLHTRTRQEDAQAAAALAEALGDLPLALAQAAAYIEQTGRTLGGYLALFERRRQELLTHPPVPVDYPHTVAATWDLSLEQVRAQSPAAVDVLALCAFLAPSPLPTAWLVKGAKVLPSSLSEVLADELRMDGALGTLRRYSLVQLSQQELVLHRLVQAVMSARLAEARGTWAEAALRFVYALFDVDTDDPQQRAQCVALLPHCLAAARNAWELRCGLELLPRLLSLMGSFWEDLAEFGASVQAFEWGLEVVREVHGKDHVAEAELLAGLAFVEFVLGKLKESQDHLEQALRLVRAAPEEVAHRVDESFLLDRLAFILLKRGALREAREHAERALALRAAARAEGSSEGELFSSTLGNVLLHQAQFDEALVHFEPALKSAETRLGPSHPDVALAAGQFAGALEMLGRYAEARVLIERSVKILEATYGPEHPKVATFLRILGDLHQRLGEPAKALDCCERALRIDEARLGPQHLDVAADLNNLARAHHELGDLERARSYFERALAIEERELGSRHIGLATVLDNLGRVYEELGNLEQARAFFERSLAIYEQEHAANHPAIANVLNNLGHLFETMGELPRARECLERALSIDEQAYGSNHPEVAIDLANLASILLKQGERSRAEEHIGRAMAIREQRLATEPVHFINFLTGVGTGYQERQEWNAAKPYLERALLEQEQLDPQAPRVAEILERLGETLRHLGEDEAAFMCLDRARSFPTKKWEGWVLLRLLIHLSATLRNLNRIGEALVRIEEAERLLPEVENNSLRGLTLLELGRIHHRAFALEKARGYLELATELGRSFDAEWLDKAFFELGNVLEESQAPHEARTRYEQALKLTEARRGVESPTVAVISLHLGQVLVGMGEYDLALKSLGRALSFYEQNAKSEELMVADVLHVMAKASMGTRKFRDAELLAKRASSIYSAHKPHGPGMTGVLSVLGQLHERAGAFEEARDAYEQVLKLQEEGLGAEHGTLTLTLMDIGRCLIALGRHVLAKSYLERALKIGGSVAVPHHPVLGTVRRMMGSVLSSLGDFRGAQACIERVLEDQDASGQVSPEQRATDLLNLAYTLWEQGEWDAAFQYVEQVLNLCRGVAEGEEVFLHALLLKGEILSEQERWREVRAALEEVLRHKAMEQLPVKERCALHNRLGIALLMQGQQKLALLHLEKALALVTKLVGTNHPEYAVVLLNLAKTLSAMGRKRDAVKRLKRARAILEEQEPGNPLLWRIREELERLSEQGD